MLNYEDSIKIIKSGFSEQDWCKVHDYLAEYFEWCKEKRIPLGVPIENLKDLTLLTDYERKGLDLINNYFPYAKLNGKRHVLEIGTLWGRFSFYLALTKDVMVSACDISQIMVDNANSIAKKNEIQNIRFDAIFAEHMGYSTNSFDFVFIFETLEHVGVLEECLRQVKRVLKSDGFMVFSVPLNDYADGGFHRHKYDKEYWVTLLSRNFDIIEIVDVDDGHRIVGLIKNRETIYVYRNSQNGNN